jgi:hypothetical protein
MDLDRFRAYTEWHAFANRRQYDAPADPWEPIRVDPSVVDRFTLVSLEWGLGRVRDGDWDRPEHCRTLREMVIYEGLRQRFEEGKRWKETDYHEWAEGRLDELGRFRGCETIEEFREKRCRRIDELFERMRTEGYRPNYERFYDTPEEVEHVHALEPLVVIGREGEVLWSEGFHRFTLADLLDITAVPVYVLRRHAGWQQRRDDIYVRSETVSVSESDAETTHPDLRDLQGISSD